MENCIVNESINNDFLSQSYSQGIERITGTKGSTFNFQIPEELLEVRKKTWDNLLNKYSKEMSDDIELNVDTLEPEEGEEEKVVSEEEYSCGQRVPMRKPATFVQYWINTGNPPYKTLLDENELSEVGSSLSEKEIISPLISPVTNADKRKCKNDSSYSSVDTAAYILSNANITKKVDTTAIVKDAKCVKVKSLKEFAIKNTGVPSNNKIEYMETSRIDHTITHNDNDNVNVDILDTELYPMSTEYMTAEVCDKVAANTLVSSNAIQSNMYSQSSSCKETDKTDESNISQRNLNVQTIDNIASIFRRFDKTSKRLIVNDKNNDVSDLDQGKVLEMDFHEKQVSENVVREIIAKNRSLTTLHRKKLYTGRNSPVDLILTETHGANRLSGAKQSLHPALDLDGTLKGEPFLTHKGKSKHSLSAKRNLDSKKIKIKGRRELNCISSDIITEISNKYRNDNKIQDTTIDSSFKNLSDHEFSNKQDDIPFQECDDTNISVRNEDFSKQNLASLNLKPVVLLEQIKSFNRCKLSENTHIAQKEDLRNRNLNKSKKLYSCKIKKMELETIDSDESTILICQCNVNASQCVSSFSDCSLDLRLDIENDFSASNAEKKDDKLSSLKNTDLSHNKELHVEGLLQPSKKNYSTATMESEVSNKTNTIWQNVLSNKSKTYSYLYGRNDMDNVKLREIKIVLEQLPLSVKNCTSTSTEMQVFDKNNAVVWEKETSNKSEIHCSNLYGTIEKDNIKLGEIRVVLERLPLPIKNCTSTMTEMQVLNKNNAVSWEKETSNKSETHFSNLYGATEKDNTKLREIRVVLERLPANICLKKNSNVTNINIFPNKKISQDTGLQTNHKRESKIRKVPTILACKNEVAVRSVYNNYSSKMNTKSKKDNDKRNDTYGIVTRRGSHVFDKIESEFTFRHKNSSKASQDDRSKYSILTFTSSDEDDFVRSIQHPRKRSKVSTAEDILGEPNIAEKDLYDQTKLVISDKDKYGYSRNLSTVIRSSKKTVQRDIDSIKKKNKHSGNTQTGTISLELLRNEGFVFSSNEDDNGSVADDSNKAKEKNSFFDSKENISNNSLRHSNGAIKKNAIDCKDNAHIIFFQTKTFDANSSDSEESNSYTSSTCKVLTSSSTHNRLRYHDSANSEEIFNDSIAKKYSKRHLGSLHSSLEKHNRTHNVRTKLKSIIDKEVKTNKRLANKESNSDIKSRISDTRKDASFSSLTNDIRVTSVQKTTLSNTLGILGETNLSKNKEISEKSKNLVAIQQGDITSTVRKLLTFQTKSYYDSSDSSETM